MIIRRQELPVDPPDSVVDVPGIEPAGALRAKLREVQLSAVLGHSAVAGFVSTVFAVGLATFMAADFSALQIQVWLAAKVLTALPRVALAQVHRSEHWAGRTSAVEKMTFGSIALDGLVWGAAGLAGAGQVPANASLVVACLAIVVTVATLGLQVRLWSTISFAAPVLGITALALLGRNDSFGLFSSMGLGLLFVQLCATGYASERRLVRELTAREQSARALQSRSKALQLASATAAELSEITDQLRRQSAVKSLFLGTMSHELRTPLHGILGMTDMLLQQHREETTTFRLGIIKAQGTHLLDLIGALLDVSRIESGRLELREAPFDLALETGRLVDLYKERMAGGKVAFASQVRLQSPHWVVGDAARVRQVLHNLLGNAVKFTKSGVVRFSVNTAGEGDQVTFEVTDTGPGITSEDQLHIFEAFRQASGPASTEVGTGLGLTIAREVAQAMSGNVTVQSVFGVGSRFTFRAVLRPAKPGEIPAAPAVARAGDGPHAWQGYRVLVVEDNDVNALIAAAALEKLGVATTRAHDGREAVLAAMAAQRPHLIFMDCRMPVLDGPSATIEIRKAERAAGLARLPIVALTATPSDADRRECLAAGMDEFITKPFTQTQLLTVMRRQLGPGDPLQVDDLDDPDGSADGDASKWGSVTVH